MEHKSNATNGSKGFKSTAKQGRRRGRTNKLGAGTTTLIQEVFPDRLVARMIYSEVLSRTAVGGFDDYEFNANSIFDPNRTGTGHQPGGRDQWAAFYGRYRVLKCVARLRSVNTSATSPVRLVLVCTNDSTAFSDVATPVEQGRYTQSNVIAPLSGMDRAELIFNVDLPKITGRTEQEYLGSDQSQAIFSSSPGDVVPFHVIHGSMDGSALAVSFSITLEYTCELFDRVQLGAS
jgi:hypothetical protein